MTAAVRSVDDRIADLFLAGHGLDFVSERGVPGGWTRADALRVASQHGWELDDSGRIPGARPQPGRPLAAVPRPQPADLTTLGPADLIRRGKQHRVASVRSAATRAERAVEKLRAALIAQVEADREAAARERRVEEARRKLAELEAEAAKLRQVIRGKPSTPPARRPAALGKSPGGNPTGPCARCGAPNAGRGMPGHGATCKP